MDTASPQPAPLFLRVIPEDAVEDCAETHASRSTKIPASLARELWIAAEGELCGLTVQEFATALTLVAERYNSGRPSGASPNDLERASFLRGLRLSDLALATGCACGRERAWQLFLERYRAPLTQAAIAMTGSATLGQDLADSLYAELYGLRTADNPEGGVAHAVRRWLPIPDADR